MFDSLATLRTLPDETVVFPGHAYAGLSTTVKRERTSGLLREFSRAQWKTMHG